MSARQLIPIPLTVALVFLAGCARTPPDTGLTKDVEHIMPARATTPETAALAPQGSTVVYADPYVVVALLELAPGDAIPARQVRDAVLYAPEAAKVGVARGGSETTLELGEGDALLLDPGSYAFDNPGRQSVELVFVERGSAALPPLNREAATFGAAEHDGGNVVLEAGPARVVTTTLAAKAMFALDAVPLRVFFALDPAHLAVTDAAETTFPVELDPGHAAARTGVDVGVTNDGDTAARLVLFEFKG